MKYPSWDTYTDEQKIDALKHELSLATHNGTTKDDLLVILRWMQAENAALKAELEKTQNRVEYLHSMDGQGFNW